MTVATMLVITIVFVTVAYFTYGKLVGRWLGVDPTRRTPAHTMTDGVDYVPAKMPVLLGHHFASIAGAGPIVGPIVAACFGWLPVWLWILIGVVFIGAVHDFAALLASVRHGGRSIGEVIEKYLGLTGKRLFLVFAWLALLLVVAVFMNVVAGAFEKSPQAATASLLFVALAVLFGLAVHKLKMPLWAASILAVAVLFLCVWVGYQKPFKFYGDPAAEKNKECILLVAEATPAVPAGAAVTPPVTPEAKNLLCWKLVLLAYIFVASVTPVWILLQPRDYLNSFLLYAILIGAVGGILLANPKLEMDAFTRFNAAENGLKPMFPLLFVMVACGAISGFHSLVASGTTAKQLDREQDAKPIGYGGMLIEGVLGVIALGTVAVVAKGELPPALTGKVAVPIFAKGVGAFMESGFGLTAAVGVPFAALAISAFALTSLDTATRLGRFAFQELVAPGGDETKKTFLGNRFVATAVTAGGGAALVFTGGAMEIWPIFGASNQLLAALCLLAVAVWLVARGRPALFVKIPMVFMFVVTLAALALLTYTNATAAPDKRSYPLAVAGVVLFVFAVILVGLAWKALFRKQEAPPAA